MPPSSWERVSRCDRLQNLWNKWCKLNTWIRDKIVISVLPIQVGVFLYILKSSSLFLVIVSHLQGSLCWRGPQNTPQPSLCIEHHFSDVLRSSGKLWEHIHQINIKLNNENIKTDIWHCNTVNILHSVQQNREDWLICSFLFVSPLGLQQSSEVLKEMTELS